MMPCGKSRNLITKIVIMTKETFGMIPLKPENKAKYTDKMVKRALMSAGLAKKINEGKNLMMMIRK